jgi:hypothetical protein
MLIAKYLSEHGDWPGPMPTRLGKTLLEATLGIIEEWKWGTPVWKHNGLICGASAFKDHMMVDSSKAASLPDLKGLFNAGLDVKATRAIDIRAGDKIDTSSLKAWVRVAFAHDETDKKERCPWR